VGRRRCGAWGIASDGRSPLAYASHGEETATGSKPGAIAGLGNAPLDMLSRLLLSLQGDGAAGSAVNRAGTSVGVGIEPGMVSFVALTGRSGVPEGSSNSAWKRARAIDTREAGDERVAGDVTAGGWGWTTRNAERRGDWWVAVEPQLGDRQGSGRSDKFLASGGSKPGGERSAASLLLVAGTSLPKGAALEGSGSGVRSDVARQAAQTAEETVCIS
jgi:hypothetical protein